MLQQKCAELAAMHPLLMISDGMLSVAGIMVCAGSVHEAFDAMYYLEQAARVTVKALSTGRPLKLVSDKVQ
jgi:ribulose-5-phosphate 4-epimerase/fuculose-1-phosphate aldolase